MLGVCFAAFAACLAGGHGMAGSCANMGLLTAELQPVLWHKPDERTLTARIRVLGLNLDLDNVLLRHNVIAVFSPTI